MQVMRATSEMGFGLLKVSWLGEIRSRLSGMHLVVYVLKISDDVKAGIRRMMKWKAPGLDGMRGFWFKIFQYLNSPLAAAHHGVTESGMPLLGLV